MKDTDENQQVFRIHVDGEGWVSVRTPADAGAGTAALLRKIAEVIEAGRPENWENREVTNDR